MIYNLYFNFYYKIQSLLAYYHRKPNSFESKTSEAKYLRTFMGIVSAYFVCTFLKLSKSLGKVFISIILCRNVRKWWKTTFFLLFFQIFVSEVVELWRHAITYTRHQACAQRGAFFSKFIYYLSKSKADLLWFLCIKSIENILIF